MEKHANEPRVHRTSSVLWLAQSDLSYESECVGCKWSLCADGVYSFSAFVMVLHEEQISAFTEFGEKACSGTSAELSRANIVYFIHITIVCVSLPGSVRPPLTYQPGRWCCGAAWGAVPLNVTVRMLWVTSLQELQCVQKEGIPCPGIVHRHLRCCQIVQWNLGSKKLCIFTGQTYTEKIKIADGQSLPWRASECYKLNGNKALLWDRQKLFPFIIWFSQTFFLRDIFCGSLNSKNLGSKMWVFSLSSNEVTHIYSIIMQESQVAITN